MTTNSNWDTAKSDVLNMVGTVLSNNLEGVLVTVVDVDGNAYRRPGAKMVATADGNETGIVTPGCLDSEIADTCRAVFDHEKFILRRFDLTEDSNDTWGLGVGCDGVITLLFESIDESHRPLVEANTKRRQLVSLVVLPNDEGITPRRVTYDPESGFPPNTPEWLRSVFRDRLDEPLQDQALTVTDVVCPHGTVEVFVEKISPTPSLVIVGSGNDVRPVVDTANSTGFRTVVVGFRGGLATQERFPNADAVISTSPRALTNQIDIDENTHFVIMTHNFVDDQLTLEALLETTAPYIGVLGPRSRFQSLLEIIEKEADLTASKRDRLYGPIGLDLGGGTPAQIALSIVSEALAVHNGRSSGHLRDGSGRIHK